MEVALLHQGTLTNTGVGPLSIVVPTAANVSGTGFAFVDTNCSATLAASQSCDTTIRYTATGQAAASGALTISTGAGNKVATLSGQSLRAVLGYDKLTLAAGVKQVGTSSKVAVRTVTNIGNVPMTNLVISGSDGFNVTDNTCPATLPAGGQCAFTITFDPGAVQYYSSLPALASRLHC